MKIVIVSIAILLSVYGVVGISFLYTKANNKTRELTQALDESNSVRKKLQQEIVALSSSQEALQKENEQQKKLSLDYLKKQKEANENLVRLQAEIEKRIQKIADLGKELKQARQDLSELERKNRELANINEFAGNIQVKKQQEHIAWLDSELTAAKERMKKQEALLHYNLGIAYTKEKSYEMAIDEFRKALEINPDDPDTHYNLGILYDDCYRNPKRSIEHYQRYLELRPDAADIDEVREWITNLMLGEVKVKQIEPKKPPVVEIPPGEKIKGIFLNKVEEIPLKR